MPYDIPDILTQFSAMLSKVDHLTIEVRGGGYAQPSESEVYPNAAVCLEVLALFTAAVTLDVSGHLGGNITYALGCVDEEIVAEVLPSLRSLYLNGQAVTSVERFVGVRRLFGRPITVSSYTGQCSPLTDSI